MSTPRVLSLVWDLIRGGTEGQCARIAMGCCRQGMEHRVGVFRHQGFFLDQVEAVCGPVVDVPIQKMVSLDTMKQVKALASYLKTEHIDILHAWDADACIFGSMAAQMAGVKLITSRRDMGEIYPVHKLLLMKRADQRSDAVVVNANAIAAFTKRIGISQNKVHTIYNILELDEFDRLRVAAGQPERDPAHLVMVARLDPEKDVGTLLQAMPGILHVHPDARLSVVGDGRERACLVKLSASLSLMDAVTFHGTVDQVPQLLAQCGLGLLVPKSNEGLSNTLLEYFAASLPVVASDCGGNRELVEASGAGEIIPIGDASACTDAVNRILSEPARAARTGAAARTYASANHNPDRIVGEFTDLYNQIHSG